MSQILEHEVKPGDCLSKIAVEYGLTWEQIWNDAANASLRSKRKDPNILMPGDIVSVPAKKKKKKNKSTGQKHNFKRKKEQSKLSLRLLFDGEPIQNQPCRLEVGNQKPRQGSINGNGDVTIEGETEFTLHSSVTFAKLFVGEAPDETMYRLYIGHLNPYDEDSGMQQRLNNLGFRCGAADGIVGPKTRAAIKRFQREHQLKIDGEPSDSIKEKLKQEHEG
ncbi:MAG: peptidoglycan-binding protein [Planctomycetota bacterium]